MTKRTYQHNESGFTMVLFAALFIAFAVIAAAAVERNTAMQQITKRDAAREQMRRLSNAIIEYSVFNRSGTTNLYPCPALTTLADTDAAFGASSLNAGNNCSDTTNYTDTAGPPVLTSTLVPVMGAVNSAVLRGMVPVQALAKYGISINDAFDPWNNRIMYVVNRNITKGVVAAPTQVGNPTLSNPITGSALPAPDFMLISYGKDGVGGTKRGNTSVSVACAATSALYRLENCDVDTTFYFMPTYIHGNAMGNSENPGPPALSATTYFDDVLVWYRQ